MNSILKNIFLYIAGKMGLELAKKTEQYNDFYEVDKISITAALSERIATITLTGSKLNVEGTSKRAEFVDRISEEIYQDHLKDACTFALGTGSALIKPYTDGEKFGFDIIPENEYVITGNTGNYIYAMLIKSSEYTADTHKYTLIESQEIRGNEGVKYLYISYTAFKDEKEIPISQTRWNDYKNYIIPNTDKLLLGRIKCPSTNRKDVNSPNGVPITFGMGEVVENIKYSYRNYNQEIHDKETLIFADKTMLTKDEKGVVQIPKNKGNLFMKIRNVNVDDKLIDTYSPDIRETELDNTIERNFRMLELLTGLGSGVLSKSTLTYTNMDEVRSMKQATYDFMNSFRSSIDSCIDDLLHAVDVIANYNNITPMGEFEAYMDWSDEYMNSLTERFNQYLQAESAGWIEAAEGRSMLMGEDIDEAREMVEKIKSKQTKDIDIQFKSIGGAQ